MRVRPNSDSPIPSRHETTSAMFEINPSNAELQDDEPGNDQEQTWKRRLRSLEEWVCELLIKNQELRMSLPNDTANNSLEAELEEDPDHKRRQHLRLS